MFENASAKTTETFFYRLKKKIAQNFKQVSLVFAAFLSMILISSFYVSSLIGKQMNTISEETMNTVQANIEADLNETKLLFANIGSRVQSILDEGKENTDILKYLAEIYKEYKGENSPLSDFMDIYGYAGGQYLDNNWIPDEDYEPTARPWYTGAIEANGIACSNPYIDAETHNVCISFSVKVYYSKGDFAGVIAMDTALTRITDYLQNSRLAGNGYGILLDENLIFYQHKQTDFLDQKMEDAGGEYAKVADKLLENTNTTTVSVVFRDEKGIGNLGFFRQIKSFNGWYIGIITPRSSYYSQAYVMVAVLATVGLILMIALSALIVRATGAKVAAHEESVRKSKFLAKMSHEMRTPMNAIIGMTNIGRNSDSMERKNYCLDKISTASTHLLGVINDVLDMSKIEADKLTMSESCFSLQSLIDQATTVVNYKIEEKKQDFTINISEDAPKAIVSDKQRLVQVVTNLLSNANKFTPEKGAISLNICRSGINSAVPMLEFEVTDNGIGISKDNQAKLFQAFSQADDSISRRFGGTGLGLAISKKIVDALGGTFKLVSEEGKGSSFSFTLPIKECKIQEEPIEDTNSLIPNQSILKSKSILIAEDIDINREIVGSLLEETGANIEFAEDGVIAVEKFAASPSKYDLILMDIQMPNMDGLTATEIIRAMRGRGSSIPIIAMTANAFKEDVDVCLKAGMNGHIGKPINFDDMLKKICESLQK